MSVSRRLTASLPTSLGGPFPDDGELLAAGTNARAADHQLQRDRVEGKDAAVGSQQQMRIVVDVLKEPTCAGAEIAREHLQGRAYPEQAIPNLEEAVGLDRLRSACEPDPLKCRQWQAVVVARPGPLAQPITVRAAGFPGAIR